MHKLSKMLLLLVILQILGNFVIVESRPEAKNGKGKAFGAGILAGGLAGAAVGHFLSQPNTPTEIHHHHYIVDPKAAAPDIPNPVPSPISRPSTIIERGETLPNGCYKQTIKEPDVNDVTKFIETEQLICPQNALVTVAPTYVYPVPVVPVQPAAPTDINPSPQTPGTPGDSPANPLVPSQPEPQTHQQSNNGVPTVPVVPVVPNNQPAVVHPVPTVAPAGPAYSASAQVIILSTKTRSYEDEKNKKNVGNRLLVINFGFILVAAAFVSLF